MDKKRICKMIYSLFDCLESQCADFNLRESSEMLMFAFDLLNEEKRAKSILGKAYLEKDPELTEIVNDFFQVGFALGYAAGDMVDCPHPKFKKGVKNIQSLLKRRTLLPYFPKERRKRREKS